MRAHQGFSFGQRSASEQEATVSHYAERTYTAAGGCPRTATRVDDMNRVSVHAELLSFVRARSIAGCLHRAVGGVMAAQRWGPGPDAEPPINGVLYARCEYGAR